MLVATPTEAKKAKILRQYADSRIDLNLDSDEKSEFLSKPLTRRRNSVRKGSIFVSHSKSPRHRQVDLLYALNSQISHFWMAGSRRRMTEAPILTASCCRCPAGGRAGGTPRCRGWGWRPDPPMAWVSPSLKCVVWCACSVAECGK